MIVADTNLIIYLLIPGEHSAAAEAAYRADPEWVSPSSWRMEFLNVLSTYCRAGQLLIDQALAAYARATALVSDMPFDVDPGRVLRLSCDSGRSGYDCIFVTVAKLNSLPLVTFDRQLLASFPETAIKPDAIEAWFTRRNQGNA